MAKNRAVDLVASGINAGRREFFLTSSFSSLAAAFAASVAASWGLAPISAAALQLRGPFGGSPLSENSAALSAANPQGGDQDSDEQRIADIVTGNHILFDQGVVDGFGHISARCVKDPAHFWLSRSRSPGIVSKADILEFDRDSEVVGSSEGSLYNERFIHGEIYRVRPDVISVVHSHAPGVIPFGLTGVPLRAVIHTAGFLPPKTPIFEIRDVAGEDNGILVSSRPIGAALAKALGDSSVVLMRGHGDAVVGPSVKAAVYRAIYTQVNAQIQTEALALGHGKITYLNPQESVNITKQTMTKGGLDRVWQIWAARANANLASLQGK